VSALERAPERLDAVGVDRLDDVRPHAMLNRSVLVFAFEQRVGAVTV